jgi:NAD+ diphosphatase
MWFLVTPRGLAVRRSGDRILFGDESFSSLQQEAVGPGQFAVPVDAPPPGFEVLPLRNLASLLDEATFAAASRAIHTVDWMTTSRFCGRCGTATVRSASERCMTCPSCGLSMWPRIAPAIIVLVRKGPLALLAHNARFPGNLYSTLAGFSEIGETLEETLVREVREEVGIVVDQPEYFGSQPWPFPHSLMIGFTAQYVSGELRPSEEITDAKWFSRDSLPEQLPAKLSIARRLVDDWLKSSD